MARGPIERQFVNNLHIKRRVPQGLQFDLSSGVHLAKNFMGLGTVSR
jgi:hypothetical protein